MWSHCRKWARLSSKPHAGNNACTLAPHRRLKARLAQTEAVFVAELNRITLADMAPGERAQTPKA
jgi:hypothetical protein